MFKDKELPLVAHFFSLDSRFRALLSGINSLRYAESVGAACVEEHRALTALNNRVAPLAILENESFPRRREPSEVRRARRVHPMTSFGDAEVVENNRELPLVACLTTGFPLSRE